MLSFHAEIAFPIYDPSSYSISEAVTINFYMDAIYGLLTFMLGVIASLLLSQAILWFHRWAEYPDEGDKDADAPEAVALCTLVLADKPLAARIGVGVIGPILLVVATVFIASGMSTPGYGYQLDGLMGWLVNSMNADNFHEISFLKLCTDMPDCTETPDHFTVRLLQALFIACVIAFPFFHMLALLILWVIPTSRKIQRYLFNICEAINGWSAIEVVFFLFPT